MMSKTELVEAAVRGDHEAFIALIDNEKDKLLRLALHYVREMKDAEDIVQDAIVRAYISLPSLKQAAAFAG